MADVSRSILIEAEFKNDASAGINALIAQLQSAANQGGRAGQSFDYLSGRAGNLGSTVTKTGVDLEKIGVAAHDGLTPIKTQLDAAKKSTDATAQSVEHLKKDTDELTHSTSGAAAAQKESVSANQQAQVSYSALGGALLRLAAQMGLVVSAAKLLKGVTIDAIRDSSAAYDSQLRLTNLLKITGAGTAQTAKEIENYASELQALSGVSDEAIKGMISTGVALGQTERQARKLAEAAVILHNRIGIDVDTAFRDLLQSLDGTAGRFGRMIPEIRDASAELLKAGGAADIIKQKFGSAGAEGVSGAASQLKEQFKELREEVGRTFQGGEEGAARDIKALGAVAKAVASLTEAFRFLRENQIKFQPTLDVVHPQIGITPAVRPDTSPDLETQRAKAIEEIKSGQKVDTQFQSELKKAADETAAKIRNGGDIFLEYAKAFNPQEAKTRALQVEASHKSLSDVQSEVAAILKTRATAEAKSAQAIEDEAALRKGTAQAQQNLIAITKHLDKPTQEYVSTLIASSHVLADANKASKDRANAEAAYTGVLIDLAVDAKNRPRPNPHQQDLKTDLARIAPPIKEDDPLADANKSIKQTGDLLDDLAGDLGQSISAALKEGIFEARSFRDVLSNLFAGLAEKAGGAFIDRAIGAVFDRIFPSKEGAQTTIGPASSATVTVPIKPQERPQPISAPKPSTVIPQPVIRQASIFAGFATPPVPPPHAPRFNFEEQPKQPEVRSLEPSLRQIARALRPQVDLDRRRQGL